MKHLVLVGVLVGAVSAGAAYAQTPAPAAAPKQDSASRPARPAPAQAAALVEFVQRGQVKGREVVTIVPQSEISNVQKDAPPHPNSSKFETLKGGDYMRLWINKGGNHYLVHFPTT